MCCVRRGQLALFDEGAGMYTCCVQACSCVVCRQCVQACTRVVRRHVHVLCVGMYTCCVQACTRVVCRHVHVLCAGMFMCCVQACSCVVCRQCVQAVCAGSVCRHVHVLCAGMFMCGVRKGVPLQSYVTTVGFRVSASARVLFINRVGQDHIYTPCMIVYSVIPVPKILCMHRIYIFYIYIWF